jgi:hypothetical protein
MNWYVLSYGIADAQSSGRCHLRLVRDQLILARLASGAVSNSLSPIV